MLNFLKKRETATTTAINPAPSTPQPIETGKETFTRDPKTGEAIYQRAMSPEHLAKVMGAMNQNIKAAQNFVMVGRQKMAMDAQLIAAEKQIVETEKQINEIVSKVRDELSLDRRWGVNLQLGVLERRDPPNG